MVIYGWNSRNIKQAELEAYECPGCQEKKSSLAIFAHYMHIFWIPLFPYKKSARIVCAHCQLDTDEKGMDDNMKGTIKKLKSTVTHPKSLFSGLVLIALAVTYFGYRGVQNAKLTQAYVENPQIGDVYIMKDLLEPSEYNHYLLKVNDIEGDSLWVSFSSYGYNGIVSELDAEDGFYDIMYSMHKSGLREYDDSGKLKKIIRDYPTSAGFDRVIEYNEYDSLKAD